SIWLPFAPNDPRIVDSTGALALGAVPKRLLVVGGGIIGLEMGTVYSTLGARLDVVEMLDGLMLGADRDLVRVWEKVNKPRFDRVMLKTKMTAIEAKKDALYVSFEGEQAPRGPQPYDLVLLSVGRKPNGKAIAADKAGTVDDERGSIGVDTQMRTNVAHIHAIGDIAGQPMLAHKAVHEGHVAAEAAAGQKSHFDARAVPSVAYTDPEIAWVGVTEDEAKAQGIKVQKAMFPWAASGRAIANGRDEGFTKLLFDDTTHRVVGGGIVGTHAGDLISEIVLAVEMGGELLHRRARENQGPDQRRGCELGQDRRSTQVARHLRRGLEQRRRRSGLYRRRRRSNPAWRDDQRRRRRAHARKNRRRRR